MEKETIKIKKQAKEFFKKNKFVSCPAFPKERVVFNSKGLSHLFYEGGIRKPTRPFKEVELRVNLLSSALKVLQHMPFIQEETTLVNYQGKTCYYFAFEAVVNERRIKVIVRQVGKGQKHFWSVIPAWRRIRGKIINAKSKLNED